MEIQEELVNQKTAKKAKELGFNWVTDMFFNSYYPNGVGNINSLTNSDWIDDTENFTSWPTQSFLQKWLRDVHGVHVEPFYSSHNKKYCYNLVGKQVGKARFGFFKTYEIALEKGLLKTINILLV